MNYVPKHWFRLFEFEFELELLEIRLNLKFKTENEKRMKRKGFADRGLNPSARLAAQRLSPSPHSRGSGTPAGQIRSARLHSCTAAMA